MKAEAVVEEVGDVAVAAAAQPTDAGNRIDQDITTPRHGFLDV